MSRLAGLSSLELLVAIGILSLLLAIAAPVFEQTVQANRLIAEANKLVRAVHMAKNEAAKHYREVVICPSADNRSCAHDKAAWAQGWLLFINIDKDRPPGIDENEPLLLSHRLMPAVNAHANRLNFKFHQYSLRSTNGTVTFCSSQTKASARAVVVSYTGRPRVATERTDGQPYSCEH